MLAGLNGTTLRVGINTWSRYVVARSAAGSRTEYDGFCLDLLHILAQALNFSYTLVLPPDGEWGDKRDGRWTGLLGLIDRQEVDLVVAPLTPTAERGEVAEWSAPFDFRYTGLVVSTSTSPVLLATAFLAPFHWQVYACVLGSVLCGTCLYVSMERVAGLRAGRPSPQALSLVLAFLFAALLKLPAASPGQQPSVSVRVFMACWCALGLMLTSCYTCKLTSLLVATPTMLPFNSLEGMLGRDDFRWGMTGGTSLLAKIRESNSSVLRRVYAGVQRGLAEGDDVLSLEAEEHLARVLAGRYVYLGEESLLDLWAAQHCQLAVIRTRLVGLETYNIFTPRHSPLTRLIDRTLLRLRDTGILSRLHSKWWPRSSGCYGNKASQHGAITVATLQGPLYAAGGGLLLAGAALCLEMALCRRQDHQARARLRLSALNPLTATSAS